MTSEKMAELILNHTGGYEKNNFPQTKGMDAMQVLRNQHSDKIFAIIFEQGQQLLINLKLTPEHVSELRQEAGIYPGYHMSKKHWITINYEEAALSEHEFLAMASESVQLTQK